MSTKLPQKTYPKDHTEHDFACFGPTATKDDGFPGTMMADMGCFDQTGKDSNKFYHACVCQSKKSQQWYAYFEWGRQGMANPAFMFIECGSRDEAVKEYIDQCRSKNTKRGKWEDHSTLGKRLVPRINSKGLPDDMYAVRAQATRSTGLPDAKTILQNEGAKPVTPRVTVKRSGVDTPTLELMRAINVGTINYTRSAMSDAAIPTQAAIDEARLILTEAQRQILKVGDNIDDQLADGDLLSYTRTLYSRIPKTKNRSDGPEKWLLTKGNIGRWMMDLDAFESALNAVDTTSDADPFGGMKIRMRHLSPSDTNGKFIHQWLPGMSRDKHANMGRMKVLNVWEVQREGDDDRFIAALKRIGKSPITEPAMHQPKERPDLLPKEQETFARSNTVIGVHGTRSVNLRGLLESSWRLPNNLVGVTITAWMFGPGVYFADDWKKSAQYTSCPDAMYTGDNPGGINGRGAFFFLADVALGKSYIAQDGHGYTNPPEGYHSVCGKRNYTYTRDRYGNRKGLLKNNEYIIYGEKNPSTSRPNIPDQCRMRYLVEWQNTF